MAQANGPALAQLVRLDGEWLRCRECDNAYWGKFRPTNFVLVKAVAHRAKAHGGAVVKPAAGRPQRRNAAPAAMLAAVGGVLVNEQALAALQGAKLGGGVARNAFDLEPTAMKRARKGQERHNLAEWHSYAAAPAHIREWLCPPIMCAADGSWMLVRKAEGVGTMRASDHQRVRQALGKYCGDLHEANVGYVDGHPVAIDYADGMAGRTLKWGA